MSDSQSDPQPCRQCAGRCTHLTTRHHPRGAGVEVECTRCDGTGLEPERRDEAPAAGKRVRRNG